MNIEKLSKLTLSLICIILTIFIIKYCKVLNLLLMVYKISIPLIIGYLYAWLLNPLITKLCVKHNRNIISVIIFLLIILILVLFIYLLVPTIYKEINEMISMIPESFDIINKYLTSANINKIQEYLLSKIPVIVISNIKEIFNYLGTIVIGLVLGLYMSMDYDNINHKLYYLIPKKYRFEFKEITTKISIEVRKCIKGTLLVSSLVLVMASIAFIILKLDAPLLLGTFCGITDLIPYIGPYLGTSLAVIVGFTKSKKIGFITLVVCLIIQAVENYYFQPVIMSKSIKLSPVVILAGLLIFSKIFGVVGMIISTPILALIKTIIIYLVDTKKIPAL